jgi:hypothetical protein
MLSLAGRERELMVLNALVDGVGERGGARVLDQDWEEAFFVEKCPGCSPPTWSTLATRVCPQSLGRVFRGLIGLGHGPEPKLTAAGEGGRS